MAARFGQDLSYLNARWQVQPTIPRRAGTPVAADRLECIPQSRVRVRVEASARLDKLHEVLKLSQLLQLGRLVV